MSAWSSACDALLRDGVDPNNFFDVIIQSGGWKNLNENANQQKRILSIRNLSNQRLVI